VNKREGITHAKRPDFHSLPQSVGEQDRKKKKRSAKAAYFHLASTLSPKNANMPRRLSRNPKRGGRGKDKWRPSSQQKREIDDCTGGALLASPR